MTFGTILKIADVGSEMNPSHFRLHVFVASIARVGRVVRWMTDRARRFFAFAAMIEWEGMHKETRRTPCRRCVARGTIQTKFAAMDLWIGVTAHTISRSGSKPIIDVALDAGDLSVLAREFKNGGVPEPFHPIRAVVTIQARVAHLAAVVGDKFGILIFVAIHTRCSYRRGVNSFVLSRNGVTRTTRHWRVVIVALMRGQGEAVLTMWNGREHRAGQARRTAMMVRMASDTFPGRIQRSMQSRRLGDLISQAAMAIQASLGIRTLKRGVAEFAARFEISVGFEIRQGPVLRMFGTEQARTEWRTPDHGKDAKQTHKECKGRTATQEPTGQFHG